MKGFKNKKGISLIVLVITIIVMIILAAAIILSISNSGIVDKANKAKTDSDTANLKEYVNVLEAEWELGVVEASGKTKTEYVNAKLSDKYPNITYSADGEVYILANDVAKDALTKGIKIGDEVKYTIAEAKEYTPVESETGTTNSKLTTQTNLKWIYIGVNEKGELLITPDVSTGVPANSEVSLYGKAGYLKGPDELDTICDKLYTVTGKGTARSMDIDDVTRILGYIGEKAAYYAYNDNNKLVYVPTEEHTKISDIISDFSNFSSFVPETNKEIGDYEVNYYQISQENDLGEMTHSENISFVFPANGDYWLSSSCIRVQPTAAFFGLYALSTTSASCAPTFLSSNRELTNSSSIRPVVSLTSKISKPAASNIWEFSEQ